MKLPFHTVLKPFFLHQKHFHSNLCSYTFAGPFYISLISVVGCLTSLWEANSIVNNEKCLKETDPKCHILPQEKERDLRLIGCGLEFCCNFLLILTVPTENPVFLMPWLFIQVSSLFLESLLFMWRLVNGRFCIDLKFLFTYIFAPFHLINLFCYFRDMIAWCDL